MPLSLTLCDDADLVLSRREVYFSTLRSPLILASVQPRMNDVHALPYFYMI